MRTEQRQVTAIATATRTITLNAGQYFCTTPKAYEVWQESPLQLVKRIPRRAVYWVFEHDQKPPFVPPNTLVPVD